MKYNLIAAAVYIAVMLGIGSCAYCEGKVGTRIVLMSDGSYECQRCYFFGTHDCHNVGITNGSLKDAQATYDFYETPPQPDPTVVKIIKP